MKLFIGHTELYPYYGFQCCDDPASTEEWLDFSSCRVSLPTYIFLRVARWFENRSYCILSELHDAYKP